MSLQTSHGNFEGLTYLRHEINTNDNNHRGHKEEGEGDSISCGVVNLARPITDDGCNERAELKGRVSRFCLVPSTMGKSSHTKAPN